MSTENATTLLGEQNIFSAALRFPIRGMFLQLHTQHSLRMPNRRYVWISSINNKGHFTWTAKYLLGCIWSSIRGISLKPQTLYNMRMPYKRCKFGCDRFIMNFTWITKYLVGSISDSIPGNILKIHLCQSLRMTYKWWTFGWDWSKMKGTILGEQSTFSAVSRLPFEGISRNASPKNDESLVAIGQ
jgi:hypothetical protein